MVQRFCPNASETFEIYNQDFMTYEPQNEYHLIYTSAAVHPLFNLRLLHIGVRIKAHWCLLSSQCQNNPSFQKLNLPKNCKTVWDRKSKLCGSGSSRPIHIIFLEIFQLPKYYRRLVNECTTMLRDKFSRLVRNQSIISKKCSQAEHGDRMVRILLNDLIKYEQRESYLDLIEWTPFTYHLTPSCKSLSLSSDLVTQHFVQQFDRSNLAIKLFPMNNK